MPGDIYSGSGKAVLRVAGAKLLCSCIQNYLLRKGGYDFETPDTVAVGHQCLFYLKEWVY